MRLLAIFLLVAACAKPYIEPLALSEMVNAALPGDVDRSEVNRDPDGCYFYVNATELFILRDPSGAPICDP